MRYYKVPIVNGEFVNVNYDTIEEGLAFDKHVKNGYGYISTMTECIDIEEISEEMFELERE